MRQGEPVSHRRQRVARATAIGTSLSAVGTVAFVYVIDFDLGRMGRSDLYQGRGSTLVYLVALVSAAAVGATLLVRRPKHSVGWCFALLAGSLSVSGICQSYGVYALQAHRPPLAGGTQAAALLNPLWLTWFALLARACLLTPTGRPMSRRWHRVDQLLVGSVVFDVGTEFLRPGPLDAPFAHTTNPWGVRSIWGPIRMVHFLTIPVAVLLIVLSALSVIIRFRRSVGEERRQLLWMAVAAVPVPPLIIVTWVANRVDAQWMTNLAAGLVVALIPVAAGLAVSKYHLYDVDRILSRAVAYLVASVVLAAAYAVVVLAIARVLGQQVGNSPAAIGAATLAVAAAARPIHRRVQETLDRHFARRRHDALNLVDAFVANPDPERSIEAVLRAALADPALAVAYWVADREQWVRVDGSATAVPDEALRVRRAGRLVAGVDFTGDPALTGLVVDRARAELDNAGLRASVSLQLQEVSASRARIASAHVEERTRIERDLHDGAQQRLLALAAHLQAALLNGDPERLRAALAFGVAESKKAVAELRELANGLHPSVLQEGGLQSAITDLARRFPISVDVDLEGRRYSPEVETTAWFVVCEAVSNAIKHAGPARVDVHVCETGGALRVTVDDDGRGGVIAEGSGISGILDRTDSIGGRLEVQSRPTGGTRVLAELPCG